MKIKFLVGVVIVALAVAAGIMLLPTKAVQKEAAAPVVSENKPQVSVARAAANLSPGVSFTREISSGRQLLRVLQKTLLFKTNRRICLAP